MGARVGPIVNLVGVAVLTALLGTGVGAFVGTKVEPPAVGANVLGTVVSGSIVATGVGPSVVVPTETVGAIVLAVGGLVMRLDGEDGAREVGGVVGTCEVNVTLSVDVAKIPSAGSANNT